MGARAYVRNVFNQTPLAGRVHRKKVAAETAVHMPLEKDQAGNPLFTPDEYLDAAQINSLLYNFTQLDHKKIARQLQKVEKFKYKKEKKKRKQQMKKKEELEKKSQVFEINVPVEVVENMEETTCDTIVSERGIKIEAWREVEVELQEEEHDIDTVENIVKKENT